MAVTYPMAFSTLGCPDWSFERAAEQAAANGYAALEVRILDGQIVPADLPPQRRKEIKATLERTGVEIIALGLSTRFSSPDPNERAANLADLKRYIELAADMGVPMVRTFGGNVEEGSSVDQAIDWVAQNLAAVAPFTEKHKVTVLLETHDAFCRGAEVARALQPVDSPYIAAVWDVHHPFRMGESIEDTWRLIGRRVRHVHIKDARLRPDGSWQLVLLGEGEVPCRDVLALLAREGYNGYICAEWEKKWHPEIEEPEVAMPQHAQTLRTWMEELDAVA
jgi:sugar phosphate isomerase/epimerase